MFLLNGLHAIHSGITAATRFFEANVPLKTISTLLGHIQLQITADLYTHTTDESMREGIKLYEMLG